MSDREARDLARREKKSVASPKKPVRLKSSENKENEEKACKKGLNFPPETKDLNIEVNKPEADTDENKNVYDHPVYKQISLKNGLINRCDLSSLKRMCREDGLDTSGKRPLLVQRLKHYHKTVLLQEQLPQGAGLLPPHPPHRGYDFYLVVDFEATCEERNAPEYEHEIIEFPGVLVDGRTGKQVSTWRQYCRPTINPVLSEFCTALTGISQETVSAATTFTEVLQSFQAWLHHHNLGPSATFALVTDGPFDVGRFLRLSCLQAGLEVPSWASRWCNVRKGFANFYQTGREGQGGHVRLPGLQTMLDRLDLEFVGNPHSGLDDAINIARVVSRMIADGAILKVNERLDSPSSPSKSWKDQKPRQLPHVSPVTRVQADLWHLRCRQGLGKE